MFGLPWNTKAEVGGVVSMLLKMREIIMFSLPWNTKAEVGGVVSMLLKMRERIMFSLPENMGNVAKNNYICFLTKE